MKKTLFLLTTLLSGLPAFAQEADIENVNAVEVRVIPRFDTNPYIPMGGKADWDFDFGTTSLYTQIEGNLGEHLTYFFSNHWLSTHSKELYTINEDGDKSANFFRTDYNNWLDMGYIGLDFGSWDFTLGKDMLAIGSFEEDDYDYETHANLNTYFWNAAQVYQWGAKAAWTNPSETSQFFAQLSSSPFSQHPFGKSWYGEGGHLKTISGGWIGAFDNYESIWSVNMMEYDKGKYLGIVGLGNRFYIDDFTITIDWNNRVTSMKKFFNQEMSLSGTVQYALSEKLEIFAKGGFEIAHKHDYFAYDDDGFIPSSIYNSGNGSYRFAGIGIHWYPIEDERNLRLHAVAAYNNYPKLMDDGSRTKKQLSLSVGMLYDFDVIALFQSHKTHRKAEQERREREWNLQGI